MGDHLCQRPPERVSVNSAFLRDDADTQPTPDGESDGPDMNREIQDRIISDCVTPDNPAQLASEVLPSPALAPAELESSWQQLFPPSTARHTLAWPPHTGLEGFSPRLHGDISLSLPEWRTFDPSQLVLDLFPDSETIQSRPEPNVFRSSSIPRLLSSQSEFSAGIPELTLTQSVPEAIDIDTEHFGNVPSLSVTAFNTIVAWVQSQIGDPMNGPGQPHHEAILPPFQLLNAFIQLYFEYFHDFLPILHQPTFNPNTGPCLLVLAVAHVGIRFSKLPGASVYAKSLGKLVDTAVEREAANIVDAPRRQTWLVQATILLQTAAIFGDHSPTIEKALATRAIVGHLCTRLECYGDIPDPSGLMTDIGAVRQDLWEQWIDVESLRRVAYVSWVC